MCIFTERTPDLLRCADACAGTCLQAAAQRVQEAVAAEAAARADAENRRDEAATLRRQVAELQGRLVNADEEQVKHDAYIGANDSDDAACCSPGHAFVYSRGLAYSA